MIEKIIHDLCFKCEKDRIHSYAGTQKTALFHREQEEVILYTCDYCGNAKTKYRLEVDDKYKDWSRK